MELENKIKCVLMDFEINEITLQEATKRILLLCVDEIIEMQTHPSDYDKHNKKVVGGRITDIGKYWQKVKKEI